MESLIFRVTLLKSKCGKCLIAQKLLFIAHCNLYVQQSLLTNEAPMYIIYFIYLLF